MTLQEQFDEWYPDGCTVQFAVGFDILVPRVVVLSSASLKPVLRFVNMDYDMPPVDVPVSLPTQRYPDNRLRVRVSESTLCPSGYLRLSPMPDEEDVIALARQLRKDSPWYQTPPPTT